MTYQIEWLNEQVESNRSVKFRYLWGHRKKQTRSTHNPRHWKGLNLLAVCFNGGAGPFCSKRVGE